MIGRRSRAGAVTVIALCAVAVPASGGAEQSRRATEVVAVGDDYFAPTELEISKNSKVKWVWDDANTNTHNVVLTGTHPKGVKKSDYRSSSGAVGLAFKRNFTVPGKYGFICTYHRSQMKQSLKVTK